MESKLVERLAVAQQPIDRIRMVQTAELQFREKELKFAKRTQEVVENKPEPECSSRRLGVSAVESPIPEPATNRCFSVPLYLVEAEAESGAPGEAPAGEVLNRSGA